MLFKIVIDTYDLILWIWNIQSYVYVGIIYYIALHLEKTSADLQKILLNIT